MYRCVIFDVDGTLIDTHKATILALDRVLKEMTGHKYDSEELKFAIGIPGEVSLPRFGIKDITFANMMWNKYLKEYQNYITVYSGTKELIIKLNSIGIKVGLVTSNTRYELNGLLKYFEPFKLMNYVESSVCADDTDRHKPYPEPILKFLEIAKVDSKEAIYIGDTLYDMECAVGSKVDFGLAGWGNADLSRTINTKFVFNSPNDIIKAVNFKEELAIKI